MGDNPGVIFGVLVIGENSFALAGRVTKGRVTNVG